MNLKYIYTVTISALKADNMKNDHSFEELGHESSTDPEPNQKKYQRYEQGRAPTLNLQQQQQRQHQYHGQKQLMAYQKPIYSNFPVISRKSFIKDANSVSSRFLFKACF